MMTPFDEEQPSSSRDQLYVKKSWWGERTKTQKGMLGLLGVCGVFLIVGTVMIVRPVGGNDGATEGYKTDTKMAAPRDVCTTPACEEAATNILEAMDQNAAPCDDFFRYACGGWIDSHTIPEGKSKWGRFYELRDQVDQANKETVEAPKDPADAASVGYLKDMYSGCMDTATIETVGLMPLVNAFGPDGEFGGWPMIQDSWSDARFSEADVAGTAKRNLNIDMMLSSFVYMDDQDTTHNVLSIDQPELGLPMSMYLDPTSYEPYITAYKKFMMDVGRVLVRELGSSVDDTSLAASAEAIFAVETSLAEVMTPDSERRNSTAMYNPMTLAEIKAAYAGLNFDWDLYFSKVFQGTDVTIDDTERIIVVQPSYFNASQFIPPGQIADLANYMHWRLAMDLVGETTQEMRDIRFEFVSALTGASSPPQRWQTCVSTSTGMLGFAAAHEYIKTHFTDADKQLADGMVNDLRASFKELVTQADWMDAATQTVAQEKADLMIQLIGYPDWLAENDGVDGYYTGVTPPDPATHLINVVRMSAWLVQQEFQELRNAPQRDVWLMHPAIVNAWYSPNHNSITFPAGILQPPFFAGGYPRYLNYGAMGVVIGHEITHGFDDQGRQYDGHGNASPWWSDSTIQAFIERAQCFIDQYSNYTLPELEDVLGEDAHLNGEQTQGENIADNGGVHESFNAYKNSVASQGPEPGLPGLENFSSEQLFFISYAQVWCEIATKEALLQQVLSDPHSPGKYRVWGPLSNSEDFVREFSCPAGSNMNRDNKCKLW